jgi:serine protease
VIAAAGNSNLETPIYPASYDNVLSVGSSTINDERTYFSNFGRTLDLVAPGDVIYTTQYNDSYVYESGTSLSAPLVSGAAALVWSVHPEFTGLQVAEQLRVSSNASIYDKNPAFLNKLGYGRLDVLSALTKQGPSVRVGNQKLFGENSGSPGPGEPTTLLLDFTNYLAPTSASLVATISTTSPYATITRDSYVIGSLGTGVTRPNTDNPFQLTLSAGLPLDEVIEILVTISDQSYEDHQLINISIPSYIDIRENNIITSLSANGRIAYGAPETQSNGSGFLYSEEHLLYEMGLVMGTSSTDLYNNVRAVGGVWDADFIRQGEMQKQTPAKRSYSEVSGAVKTIDDRLDVGYRSLVWNEDPNRNFIIIEYTVKNTTAVDINDFYMGLFADWDIADEGAHDRAGWDADTRLGYVFPVGALQMPRAGIQALTGQPQYHAIDNDQALAGNPFGLYDGFTNDEKFTSISEGVARTTAGASTAGGDVSHTVGSGPYLIHAGETITLAFALHAAMTQDDLIASAKHADTVYNYTLKAPLPVIADTKACADLPTVLKPTGASAFNLYRTPLGGQPVATGPTLSIGPISRDSVVYIANADHTYESLRTPATISVVGRPHVEALGIIQFCEGGNVTLQTAEANGYLWSTGETTQSITVSSSGSYSVEALREEISCPSDNSQKVQVNPLPDASFTTSPAVLYADQATTFTANNNEALSWLWQVKDGGSGEGLEFLYTFPKEGVYTVALTVTDINQCVGKSSAEVGLITGIESAESVVAVYPNPVVSDRMQIRLPEEAEVFLEIIDVMGRLVLACTGQGSELATLNTGALQNGQYVLRVSYDGRTITQKFIIAR